MYEIVKLPLNVKIEVSAPMVLCSAIRPLKKNERLFGCIRDEGHGGMHVNGKGEAWTNGRD